MLSTLCTFLGSLAILWAALLQTADSLVVQWAWLDVARQKDRESYERATHATWSDSPFVRAVGGVSRPEELPWIPPSVQLDRANLRLWGWILLSSGALLLLYGVTWPLPIPGLGPPVEDFAGLIWCVFVTVLLVAGLLLSDHLSKKVRGEEEDLAHEALCQYRNRPDRK